MPNFIQSRFSLIEKVEYFVLDQNALQGIADNIYSTFLRQDARLKDHLLPLANQKDISDEDPTAVRQYLTGLPIQKHKKTYLIWMADRAGVQMMFGDFVQYYDDIWYPSSDDTWIVSEDFSWFLAFDHEEIVTFLSIGLLHHS